MPAREKLSFLLYPLSFVIVIPFCLAAPQLFPTIDLYRNSARVAHEYQQIIGKMLIQWWQLPLLVVQEFLGNPATKSNLTGDYVGKTLSVGAAGFFLVLVAVTSTMKSWYKKFFLGAALSILLITVNTPITQLLYRYPIPVFSAGGPTRILFLFTLSLSILAGFGFDTLAKSKKFPMKPTLIIMVILLICWIATMTHSIPPIVQNIQAAFTTMRRALIFSSGVAVAAIFITFLSQKKYVFMWMFIPLCIVELLYGFIKFNPFVPRLFVFPQNKLMTYFQTHAGISRFWGYGTAAIEANFATQEHVYSPDGTDPLNLKRYNQFLQSSAGGKIALTFDSTTRSDAQIRPGYGELDLPRNTYRLRVLDMLGVTYIINRPENPKSSETFPESRFKEVWHEDDWIVYNNLLAAPRYFITSDVRSYTDIPDFERQFFATEFHPDKTVLIDARDSRSLPQLSLGTNTTKLLVYEPTWVQIAVKTDTPQFLFLSDTFDEGWKASVNNIESKLYRTNFAFRGVAVPKGESTVEFFYSPAPFRIGLYLSLAACIVIISYCFITVYVKRGGRKYITNIFDK